MRASIDSIRDSLSITRKSYDISRELREEEEEIDVTKNFSTFVGLNITALGVVYGDIGTSPLYTISSVLLNLSNPTIDDIIGGCSLVLWTIMILVTLKYSSFILNADYKHEGGIFAMCTILLNKPCNFSPTIKNAISIFCIIGASFLLGDGAITPAISVLSAMSGIALVNPNLSTWVVPLTVVVLLILFFIQPYGTSKIGRAFGPVILIWFCSIFIVGIYNISLQPQALLAFNPGYAITFLFRNGTIGYLSLGSVFLSVTGLESLYADLGHFHKSPIRFTWLFIAMPSVMSSYLGQCAYMINNPQDISTLFYSSTPIVFYWPMFILATLASIIASQAIITGSYSVISQAISLGFAPPVEVVTTSKLIRGQIYISSVNWILMILTVAVVLGFQTSSDISNAYGVTICTMMVMTTILFMATMRFAWKLHLWKVLCFGLFLIVDFSFLGSVYAKILNGGYVAIVNASVFGIPMLVWYLGEQKLKFWRKSHDTSSPMEKISERIFNRINASSSSESSKGKSIVKPSEIAETDNTQQQQQDNKETTSVLDSKQIETKQRLKSKEKKTISEDTSSSSIVDTNKIKSNFTEKTKKLFQYKIENPLYINMLPSVNKQITHLPLVAVFLCTSRTKTPSIFEDFITRVSGIPSTVIFLRPSKANIPIVPTNEQHTVKLLGENIYFLNLSYGYAQQMKSDAIERAINSSFQFGIPNTNIQDITIFASAEVINIVNSNILWKIVLYLYALLKRLFFGVYVIELPPRETVYLTSVAIL